MPTFLVCGTLGFACAGAVGIAVALHLGLSAAVLGALIAVSAATFMALTFATRAIEGEERLVYYHHEIAVLTVSALLLLALGQPVLRYLDLVTVGLGVFLTFGRFGCFAAGCCHGMPHPWGLRYSTEHADAGFPRWLVGVPLLPVPLVEAFACSA